MKQLLSNNIIRLYKHFLGRNIRSNSMVQDLDELIKQKDNFIKYINFEYSVAIIYNIMMSISSFLFLNNMTSSINHCDKISTLWIIFVSIVKLVETFPKIIIVYQTNRIANHNTNDDTTCMRRLMNMIRSKIFYYNIILGYTLLLSYTSFFLIIKRNIKCDKALCCNINLLICGFFLRMIISFINYHFYFKYGTNHADLANIELYSDPVQKVEKEVLEMISFSRLSMENKIVELDDENELCCICINIFTEGDAIKILPCNPKHIFHFNCIDKWLSCNKACPTCRTEINKQSFKEKN